jgi:hypothetical protein
MARYHGKAGRVYVSTSGTGAASPLCGLAEWSVNSPTDKVEVTAFCDGNKVYVQGFADLTGEVSGFWEDDVDTLYEASRSTDGVKMYIYPSADAATKYWYGPAWVDFSMSGSTSAAVAISGSFVANGTWGWV